MAAQEQDVQIAESLIEIRTSTDEELVQAWAIQNSISTDAIEKLFKEGFTSMRAIKLIDGDDLARTKIPRGQQKLILASVKGLNSVEHAGYPAQETSDATGEATPTALRAAVSAQTHNNDQSTSTGSRKRTDQDGGALGSALSTQNGTDAFNTLLNSLQSGQSVAKNILPNNTSDNTLNNHALSVPQGGNNLMNSNVNSLSLSSTATSDSQSWRDPQIFLESAALGKSAPTHYDITDFVSNTVEEEIIVGGNGMQQVVVKSGPRKPKLENVSLAQWSVANLAILYRLISESKLHAGNILDYLSYTTKICQLVQKYTIVSVLLYDREYRQLQARHGFRWGTDVPHFHTIHLQPRVINPGQLASGKTNTGAPKNTPSSTPMTLDGKVICKLYNSKAGCHYKECRFAHQCSHAGCHQYHSAQTHNQSKN